MWNMLKLTSCSAVRRTHEGMSVKILKSIKGDMQKEFGDAQAEELLPDIQVQVTTPATPRLAAPLSAAEFLSFSAC